VPAVGKRTDDFQDLLWQRQGDGFELAVEAAIPKDLRVSLREPACETIRYEIALQLDPNSGKISIRAEKILLKTAPNPPAACQQSLFPITMEPPETIMTQRRIKGAAVIVNKIPEGNDNFYSEVHRENGKGWVPSFKFGPQKSSLANLPADEANFPVTSWLKNLLVENLTRLTLNPLRIRQASPPDENLNFKADGSNLPWVIDHLKSTHPDRFAAWISHLRSALPDLADIDTIERKHDHHRYMTLAYDGGLKIPSWMASEGTLRLMALSILPHIPDLKGIFLIENPENGIHPEAVESVFHSLSSVPDAQILVKTHSPAVFGQVNPANVLWFGKTKQGLVEIGKGDERL
jgi:hypothetical protein